MNYIGQQAMWLPYNAFKRIADTLQVTCKPHATVTKRVVIWSASYSASHFVRKDHMTHISNLRQRSTSTALIFLHLPSSVPPFHAQAWRTAQATQMAFLLKHAQGRMSTWTLWLGIWSSAMLLTNVWAVLDPQSSWGRLETLEVYQTWTTVMRWANKEMDRRFHVVVCVLT